MQSGELGDKGLNFTLFSRNSGTPCFNLTGIKFLLMLN